MLKEATSELGISRCGLWGSHDWMYTYIKATGCLKSKVDAKFPLQQASPASPLRPLGIRFHGVRARTLKITAKASVKKSYQGRAAHSASCTSNSRKISAWNLRRRVAYPAAPDCNAWSRLSSQPPSSTFAFLRL